MASFDGFYLTGGGGGGGGVTTLTIAQQQSMTTRLGRLLGFATGQKEALDTIGRGLLGGGRRAHV